MLMAQMRQKVTLQIFFLHKRDDIYGTNYSIHTRYLSSAMSGTGASAYAAGTASPAINELANNCRNFHTNCRKESCKKYQVGLIPRPTP